MPVQYNSRKIIPAPLVSVEKSYDRTGDGHKVGSKFTLNVKGTITCTGSPNSVGEFWMFSGYPPTSFQTGVETVSDTTRQKILQNKMQSIRHLFADDGLSFEVQPWDGSAPMKCYPRVISLNFEEGIWYDRIDYTIVLEADELFGINNGNVKDAEDFQGNEDFFKDAANAKLYLTEVSENWQLEAVDNEPENADNPYTFRLTHNLSATGKRTYDDSGLVSEGWEQAKRWVVPRLGIDLAFVNSTSSLNLSSMLHFNHIRQENTDELAGTYSVSETWVLSKANTIEDFTVSTQTSLEDGLTSVNVEGEVTGLDTRDAFYVITESKWTAALAKFNTLIAGNPNTIFTRAQNYSGVTLNATLLASTVGRNPVSGRISYNYQYNNRPTSCVVGALSESIQISDKNPTDVFALIPVIGRLLGPVIQNMGTFTERHRTVSIDVNVVPVNICPNTAVKAAQVMAASPASAVDTIIQSFYTDLTTNYTQVLKEEDNPTWNPRNGKYSRVVSWVYQNCS